MSQITPPFFHKTDRGEVPHDINRRGECRITVLMEDDRVAPGTIGLSDVHDDIMTFFMVPPAGSFRLRVPVPVFAPEH